jgi:hypothetical protein
MCKHFPEVNMPDLKTRRSPARNSLAGKEYRGKQTKTGNSSGFRFEGALFKSHPEFNGERFAPPAGLGVGSGLGRDALKLGCSPSVNFARGPWGLRRLSHRSRTMKRNVVSVDSISPLELAVRVEDGTEGNVRLESSHLSSLNEALKDPGVFQQARVESGGFAWLGEPDLAPDAICREINRPGEWRLR